MSIICVSLKIDKSTISSPLLHTLTAGESKVKGKPAELELGQVTSTGEQERDSPQQAENGGPFNVTTPTEDEAKRESISYGVILTGPRHY